MAHNAEPKKFSVTMQFDANNAVIFESWYSETDMSGLYPFLLPRIDRVNGSAVLYRFSPDTSLKWHNTKGHILECTFDLEEC